MGFLGAPVVGVDELVDRIDPRPVLESRTIHEGYVFDLVSETADLGEAGTVRREFLRHPGAVAILALDDEERLVVVQQYRHPVGAFDWEIPAGLLDVAGEPPQLAAARELGEEADLRAEQWDVLVDYWTTPGGNDEAIRVFLARGLSPVPEAERHEREDEELGMPTVWATLDNVQEAVLSGRLHNPSTCIGVLAACAARDRGWATLRPADAPWPEHPRRR
ncbi:NUDIX hydrolase [Arsenicicoccus piscis]|uniref:NTP pyrophosphohydrolase n=1 Tax=Arsenicicoccus piscis TaxID=673954 RepID=A0ABQ6HMU7_9MICO|nr:NUDIX hydrolase [Arsenicicoccus piscis]MCH8627034.1 NUDIX hydrolase [Arsenicicoccus piscis]GMA19034.1 NTP pyrophosphohydrolase [Arsenicicoccus piscis]